MTPKSLRGIRSRLFRHSERGFYLIGLLLVLVIIMILAGRNFQSASGSSSSGSTDITSMMVEPLQAGVNEVKIGNSRIDNTKDLACEQNRDQTASQLTMLSMTESGMLPDEGTIHIKLGYIGCPAGGKLQYDDQGNVYCTKHDPAPQGLAVHNL